MSEDYLAIYTDGGHRTKSHLGAWGVHIPGEFKYEGMLVESLTKAQAVVSPEVTNNRMELMGAIEGLRAVEGFDGYITVFSDSQYVINGISQWIKKWRKNNWRSKAGPVKNQDLWKELDSLNAEFNGRVTWKWVKGHAGNKGNEKADKILNKAMDGFEKGGVKSVIALYSLVSEFDGVTVSEEQMKDILLSDFMEGVLTQERIHELESFNVVS